MQVISGINFYLYARAARQFSSFHICLERANRFLLVAMLCRELDAPDRAEMRKKLIQAMLDAPMLTLSEVTGVPDKVPSPPSTVQKQSTFPDTNIPQEGPIGTR